MSAILSFLGGSAFRAIWGEVSHWFTARQELKAEVTRMKLQGELDAAQHARNQDAIRLQAELGVKTIHVQADAAMAESDAAAWRENMARAATPTGIRWVDAWNGCIRPAFGTLALGFVIFLCWVAGPDVTRLQALGVAEVMFSVIGFYFADRTLKKAGK
jgi:hypothetical protein